MKKIKTILFSVMTILVLLTATVYAAEPQLEITGDSEAEAGETKTLTVKIVSESDMGVYSGKIAGDTNISNLQITGKNGWSVIAQQDESFKLIKAQGGKNEEALEISYTIAENATGKANITLSNIELTTLDYETKTVADITKEISIKTAEPEENPTPAVITLTSLEITKAPSKVKYTEGEKFNKAGLEVTAKYSDNTTKVITDYTYTPSGALKVIDKKVVISYTENDVTKTVEQAITVEKKASTDNTNTTNDTNTTNTTTNDNNNKQNTVTIIQSSTPPQQDTTVANKELSKAGMGDLVFYATMAISVLGVVFYIKYNKMKDVK